MGDTNPSWTHLLEFWLSHCSLKPVLRDTQEDVSTQAQRMEVIQMSVYV